MLRWLEGFLDSPAEKKRQQRPETGEKWPRLEAILGFRPSDLTHYRRALRHRSIIDDELYEPHETYERLEFLGDSVLDLVITEIIFEEFPEGDEGFMTKLRAKLVRGDTLYLLSKNLELNTILEVGERAHGQGIELSKSVLADVFESLVAAIYLTEGYEAVRGFVQRVIEQSLDLSEISGVVDNFKSELLEYSQAHKLPLPYYRVIAESGPGHNKTFEVAVSIDGVDYGTGIGKTKKKAEQIAAKRAFKTLESSAEK